MRSGKMNTIYRSVALLTLAVCTRAAVHSMAQTVPGAENDGRDAARVRVVSADEMSGQDAALLSAHRADVAGAAEFFGYNLHSGAWIQKQVLCPDSAGPLLMHYESGPATALSLFTAVIPLTHGPVRIVPVLYRGRASSAVFGSSPVDRGLINEAVSAKSVAGTSTSVAAWTNLAYCYAALTGEEPPSSATAYKKSLTPVLSPLPHAAVQRLAFLVPGPDGLSQNWVILFDRQMQVKSSTVEFQPSPAPLHPQAAPLKLHPVN